MDPAALMVDKFVAWREKESEYVLTDRPEKLEQAIRNLVNGEFNLEIVTLLYDINHELLEERDRIQKILDHQQEYPADQYDPDEYLEGAVKALQWVAVMIDRRLGEVN